MCLLQKFAYKIYSIYKFRLKHTYYQFLFRYLAYIFNISIKIGRNVQFNNKTICYGVGKIYISNDVNFGYHLGGFLSNPTMIQPRYKNASIYIGNKTFIMQGCEFIACEEIVIGENCRIGSGSIIYDSDFHGIAPEKRDQMGKTAPVKVGNNVWFGINVTVLKGVQIGNDVVVGASCVVTNDVPDGSIVVGNPMKIIGSVYSA